VVYGSMRHRLEMPGGGLRAYQARAARLGERAAQTTRPVTRGVSSFWSHLTMMAERFSLTLRDWASAPSVGPSIVVPHSNHCILAISNFRCLVKPQQIVRSRYGGPWCCESIKALGWTFEEPGSRMEVNTPLATNV
jgi:hypothetical protein